MVYQQFKSIYINMSNLFIIQTFYCIVERQWLWAFPQIEGVPPSPRGGHSATLTGASLVIFGVSTYDFHTIINMIVIHSIGSLL